MVKRSRSKLNMELISNEKSRHSTFLKRKDGLLKKIYELSTLCGIEACMIAYGPNQTQPYTWPENEEKVRGILTRYKEHPDKDVTNKRSMDLTTYINTQKQKVEHDILKIRQQNEELENCAKRELVENLNQEQLRKIYWGLDSKLKLVKERIVSMKEEIGSQEETGMFGCISDSSGLEQSPFLNVPLNAYHHHGQTFNSMQVHADVQPFSFGRLMTDAITPTSNNSFPIRRTSNALAINQIYLDQMRRNFVPQNSHFQYQGLRPLSNGFGHMNQGSPIMSSFDNFPSNVQPNSSPYVFSYQPYVVTQSHNQMSEFEK